MIPRVRGRVGEVTCFSGTAYDFGHRVCAIEFSLDNGTHWTRYDMAGLNDYQNVSWKFEYIPKKSGFYILKVRSVNDVGDVSPEADFVEFEVE